MDHDRNASVALLMLDIASAKSSLAQLQQTFDTATAEHRRTLDKLHCFREQCDVSPVYADGATAGVEAMSRQLQTLHIENLQLQSLLKQEIEARQQLQHQHAALLSVFRSCGMQDILNVSSCATTSQRYASADATTSPRVLEGAGHLPALEQHELPNFQQRRGTGQQAVYTMPVTTDVAGTEHDSIRLCSSKAVCTGANTEATVAGSHTSSAYFPAQQQHFRLNSRPSAYQQHSPPDCSKAQQQLDSKDLYAAVASVDARGDQQSNRHDILHPCNHSQHSSQPSSLKTSQRHDAVPAGSACPSNSPEHEQHADGEGGELSGSESMISSCTQSAATELLDSDDLEELAGLCDGLIGQASRQQVVYAAMQDCADAETRSPVGCSTWRAETAAGAVGTTGGEHNQQSAAFSGCIQHPMPGARKHQRAQLPAQQQRASKQPLGRYDDVSAATAQHSSIIETPDIEVLAAELSRLQQRVAAAGIHTGPTAAAVRAALGAASNAATSFRIFNTSAGSSGESSTTTSATGSTSSTSPGIRQPAAVPASTTSAMADLQQQLAARMAEVKERLSSICNGMLEEALGTGGASAMSPSTAKSAASTAGQPVQGYADSRPHADQAQQHGPASAIGAARAEPTSWTSSMSSSRASWAAGALKPQTSARNTQADTTATKLPPSVAFEVHADGHANSYVTPAAPADAAAGNTLKHCLKHPPYRVRAGGPAFWSGSRVAAGTAGDGWTQAAIDNGRASNYVPQQVAGNQAPAANCSRHSSDILKEEAPAGSSSESSWLTADEEEAEQQEQQHLPTPQHQQGRQQQQGLRSQFASASGQNLHPDAFQTPPKQPQQQTRQQQYEDLENTDNSAWPRQQRQQPDMYRTPAKHQIQEPVTGVSGSQQTGSWGPSPLAGDPGFDAASSNGSFHPTMPGQWQERQQRGGLGDGLEGVLFGLKGRVAAEVSQTFSPLKTGTAAGGTSGAPVTPLRPRNT